ncbi:hypothetical protein BC827DRAFT_1134591 [Russula dissimulans]|nr:hypothetical protein BC827DRAFT_1134591 [Russula dissimulans]
MQNCPPEIHAYIFELACTDGGATGVALSAVSHYVRAMSAPYQWCTLSVAGTPQTVRLVEHIRSFSTSPSSPSSHGNNNNHRTRIPAKLGGPAISHLFISNRPPARARELRYTEMGATRDMVDRRRIETVFNIEADAWARAVRELFAYAAPTLRTLAMMCYDIHVSPNGRLFFSDLKRYRFPRLEELSIRGGFDTRLRDYDGAVGGTTPRLWAAEGGQGEGGAREGEAGAAALAMMSCAEDEDERTLPALRRLHLASPISFDLFLHRLRPLAPGLTHVRLSELLAFDYDMTRALHSELSERGAVPEQFPSLRDRLWSAEPRAVPVDWERFLPPPGKLRRLVVQPAQLPPAPEQLCGCCSGYYRVDDMTRLLREMARESSRAVAEGGEGEESVFVFLPPGPRHNAYSFEEGYRDWLARATGERGCWKEQYEVDIDAQPPPPPPVAEDGLRLWDISVKRSISRTWF